MPPAVAVHVTVPTALSRVKPSSVVTGLASLRSVVATCQPGWIWTLTSPNGASAGRVTVSFTVLAVSDSVGTRKTSLPKPPGAASGDDTTTWAEAGPARSTPRAA